MHIYAYYQSFPDNLTCYNYVFMGIFHWVELHSKGNDQDLAELLMNHGLWRSEPAKDMLLFLAAKEARAFQRYPPVRVD